MKTRRCEGCGGLNRASGDFCRTCKSAVHHALVRVRQEGLLVDVAGGSWWVWSPAGEVLVLGKDTKRAAVYALAMGEELES